MRIEPAGPNLNALNAEDLARILMTFRGQPRDSTPHAGSTQRPGSDPWSDPASVYVVDRESGLAFLLD